MRSYASSGWPPGMLESCRWRAGLRLIDADRVNTAAQISMFVITFLALSFSSGGLYTLRARFEV